MLILTGELLYSETLTGGFAMIFSCSSSFLGCGSNLHYWTSRNEPIIILLYKHGIEFNLPVMHRVARNRRADKGPRLEIIEGIMQVIN